MYLVLFLKPGATTNIVMLSKQGCHLAQNPNPLCVSDSQSKVLPFNGCSTTCTTMQGHVVHLEKYPKRCGAVSSQADRAPEASSKDGENGRTRGASAGQAQEVELKCIRPTLSNELCHCVSKRSMPNSCLPAEKKGSDARVVGSSIV